METLFDHLVFIDQGKILLSNSVPEIAMKLQFKNVTSFEENEAILYKEEIPGGYATISRNLTGEELPVDIEFLFSAVTGLAEQVIEELNP